MESSKSNKATTIANMDRRKIAFAGIPVLVVLLVIAIYFIVKGKEDTPPVVSPTISEINENDRRIAELERRRQALLAEQQAAEAERQRLARAEAERRALAEENERKRLAKEKQEESRGLVWLRGEIITLIGKDRASQWYPAGQPMERLLSILYAFSHGQVNARHVSFLTPEQKFPATRQKDTIYHLDPAGYQRFDRLVDTLVAIEPAVIGKLFRRTETVLNQLHTQLGFDGKVKNTVFSAINHVQKAPVIRNPIKLVRPSVSYRFADRKLENLDAGTKQLIRMGPENTTKLKNWLAELKKVL